ncbi:glycosyltransferase [Variovorax sp. PAMC28562]|uniref:glycosyltransferase n=1 Tax=Variovorax sp. PAMC28562 TaxID=2762323 RepID=UPI00164DE6B0|nr:glycosyltransferase [Variovorax sp. PAMC28562]QNK75210.1 glycosyltransferase [Variovorax sp. PAMC28562]
MIERIRSSEWLRKLPQPVKRMLRRCYNAITQTTPTSVKSRFPRIAERPPEIEVETVVVRVYEWALERLPGPEDRQYWIGEVMSGRMTTAAMIENIATSSEAAAVRARAQLVPKMPNGKFIQFAYGTLLGRSPMAQEIGHWDQLLKQTLRRDKMALGLLTQRATRELTDAPAPPPFDPGTFPWMGMDRFISIKEWQDKAAVTDANPPPLRPRIYPSLRVANEPTLLVSAIASLYRGGEYIEQFMQNITSQSLFARSELIIIDANSPENEYEVIARYMERFPNIVYHRAATRIGIYEAWNLGVQMAKGRYVTNTNMDDLRRHDSFERQAEVLKKFDFVDVVYQDFYYGFEGKASFDRTAAIGVHSAVPVVTPYNLMQSNFPHNAPMWRRELHSDVGMFDTSYRSAGDFDFWLRCVRADKTFFKINDPHVVYFVNPEGLSTRPDTRGIEEPDRARNEHGPVIISPWLVSSDEAFVDEIGRRAGFPVEIAPADRQLSDWRYTAVQTALRRCSAASRRATPH